MEQVAKIVQNTLIAMVSFYKRLISPLMISRCRFQPTCSTYAIQAIKKHGSMKGIKLVVSRILRCHPLSEGGYDPVE